MGGVIVMDEGDSGGNDKPGKHEISALVSLPLTVPFIPGPR